MEHSWRLDNTRKIALNVRGILDLNWFPSAIQAGEARNSKSGRVSFALRLPKRGLVRGECIDFIVELINHSNRPVTRTCVQVIQVRR